jgi:hypothetical protein
MQGTRSIIGTAVALGLLAGSTIGVAAQEEGATAIEGAIDPCTTPVAPATGVIRWGHEEPGTEAFVSASGEHIREFRYVNTMEMEDDRLDGSTSGVNEWDFSLDDGGSARNSFGPFDPARAGVARGTFRIENADGSWEGPWVGAGESTYSWQAVVTLTGAEGYEGLSATLFLTSSREPAAPVVGSIYPTDIASCDFTAVE